MKKLYYVLFNVILLCLLVSCFKTSFNFPNNYENSKWIASSNDIVISLDVISYDEVYANINSNDNNEMYEVSFRVDNMGFRCLDKNKNYILEDGTVITRDLYYETFPNVSLNVKNSTFYITKTKDKHMNCYIIYNDLYYIFPYIKNIDENILFEFHIVD